MQTCGWFRFSVGGLLFLTLCVCGLLGGYRFGFERGRAEGLAETREEKRLRTIHARQFFVEDLVNPPEGNGLTLNEIMKVIHDTVGVDQWTDVGGPHAMREFEANNSIVVGATGAVHDEVADLLEQIRRLNKHGTYENGKRVGPGAGNRLVKTWSQARKSK